MAADVNPEEVVLLLADEYSRMAETYDRNVTPHFAPIAERVLRAADPKAGEMFLDLGTGTGLLACKVAPKVAPQTVVAIDLADGALAAGTYRAAALGIKSIRFEMMDVRNIVYRGGLFDGVVSNLGIPYFGTDRCFRETARVLKPTGRFVFTEWGEFSDPPQDALMDALRRYRNPDPPRKLAEVRAASEFARASDGCKALRDPKRTEGLLRAAGFRKVEVANIHHTAVFDPRESYMDFRLSWGAFEAEVAGMPRESREAFMADMRRELGSIAGGDRLEAEWLLHLYVARVQ
jgi:ubiquinone/menaquinone biosynthesis C-methylase UbiE